jgi:spermidine synthase
MSSAPDPTASAAPRLRTLYVLFTLSGACGLCYQVLWARWLSLVLGSTTASVSIVLASFMLGLALGSWVAGRTLPRVRRPLRVYGLLEVGIGVFALAFPLLTRGAEALLALLVDADTPRPAAIAARAGLAFALLLLPTAMMGATLPQLTALVRAQTAPGARWRLGLLYALNTTGAALGTLAVSFVLIELVGVRATTLLAALLNVAVGWMALRLDVRLPAIEPATGPELPLAAGTQPGDASGPPPAPGVTTPWPPLSRLPLIVLAATGAAALAGEVLWVRWLEVLAGNSSYAFAWMLLMYLVGIAVGSAAPSLWIRRLRHPEAWLVATQIAAAVWVLVAVASFDRIAVRLATDPSLGLTIPELLAAQASAASLLLPAALLSGAVFPLATRLLSPAAGDASGEVAAQAYAWNTLGAVAGALIGGWVIAPRFDFAEAILVLAVAHAAIAAAVAAALLRGWPLPRRRAAALLAASLLVAILAGAALQRSGGYSRHLQRRGITVLFHDRSAQGITTVASRHGNDRFRSVLLVNAKGMTLLTTATKMMAHLPLLAHPRPRETAVVCFGMGTTFRSAMSHGGRVVAVELVPEVFDAFPVFHPDAARVAADPRGRLVVDDGRNFLRLTRQRFDVITIDPPPPIDAAGVNHLHSLEFMLLARQRLAPGGIMAHWIPYPHAGAGVSDWHTFGSLVHTFTTAFPYVMAVPGRPPVGVHLLGSERPIPWDLERVRQRLEDPAVRADLDEWKPFPREYFASLGPVDRERLAALPLVTDDRPRLEFELLRLWRVDGQKPGQAGFW